MKEVKDYAGENQRILDRWMDAYTKKLGDNYEFAEDGLMFRGAIVSDGANWRHEPSGTENELWSKCPIRILYLTKEQNGGDIESGDYGAWDVRADAYHDPYSEPAENKLFNYRGGFNKNLVYSLYGLFKATPDHYIEFEDVNEEDAVHYSDIIPYARINCKKIPGGSNCDEDALADAMKEFGSLLIEQINNLDADVFVCCGNKYKKNAILDFLNNNGYNFKEPEDNESYDIWYDEEKNKIAIDSYHLSYYSYARKSMYEDIVWTYHNFLRKHPSFYESHRK